MDHRKWNQEHILALQRAITVLDIQQFPFEILKVIELYIPSITVIRKLVSLESNIIHYYDTLKIASGGILSVEAWDPKYNRSGGVLRIHCNTLIIESKGKIDVTGKGYKGGNRGHQGYSITFEDGILPQRSYKRNKGGGGIHSGGGYGTAAKNYSEYEGGCSYGNKKVIIPINTSDRNKNKSKHKTRMKKPRLKHTNSGKSNSNNNCKTKSRSPNDIKYNIYLGSGGGGDDNRCGSDGGGAIAIECRDRLIMHKKSAISADGGNGIVKETKNSIETVRCGGFGSGGSIYIKSPSIELIVGKNKDKDKDENRNNNNRDAWVPKISAIGGVNTTVYRWRSYTSSSYYTARNGGMGRIRIDCSKECYDRLIQHKINLQTIANPPVGYFSFFGKFI